MVWVERKFCSNMMVVTLGKARSNSKMLRMSAPRQRYTDWSESPTTQTLPCASPSSLTISFCAWFVSWNSSTRMCRKRSWYLARTSS